MQPASTTSGQTSIQPGPARGEVDETADRMVLIIETRFGETVDVNRYRPSGLTAMLLSPVRRRYRNPPESAVMITIAARTSTTTNTATENQMPRAIVRRELCRFGDGRPPLGLASWFGRDFGLGLRL